MKKKLLTIASVCLILALAALPMACGEVTPTPTPEPGPGPTLGPGPTPPTPPTGEPQYGGTLKISGVTCVADDLGYPPTLRRAGDLIYIYCSIETLLRYDKTGAPIPWLATGWEVSPDLTSITIPLRKGVKFHDGTDFNAEAVKWNLDQYPTGGRSELKRVESIDILDDYTVRLNLSEFDNSIINNLGFFPGLMISPTAYQTHGEEWCEKHPVGTGPFKLASWEVDVSIKFERFDDYWQEGKPYLDRVEFIAIADPTVAVAAFQVGEVDVLLSIGPKDIYRLEAVGKYQFNVTDGGRVGMAGDSAHEYSEYADVRVRRAVDYAIDKEAIVDGLTYGLFEATDQFGPAGSWGYNPDVVGYPYNPDKARQLLAEAGYPDGFKTVLHFGAKPSLNVEAYTACQGYLTEVGIDTEVDIQDPGRQFKMVVGGGWEHSLASIGIGGTNPDVAASIAGRLSARCPLWGSILRPDDYEDTITAALTAPDFETKKALTHEVQRLMTDKYALTTWLYVQKLFAGRYPDVHDTGLYEVNECQWRPEDAWLSQ